MPSAPRDFSLDDFNQGSPLAFHRVYSKCAASLLKFVQVRIENSTDSKDIVAEAWCKLYFHAIKYPFNSYSHIIRWLYRVVVNCMIDYSRAREKASTQIIEAPEISDDFHLDDLIEIELARNKVLLEIMQAVEDFPPQRKVVFKKYFIEQKQTDEIASEMGLNPQTVLNTKNRALRTLRNIGFKLYN